MTDAMNVPLQIRVKIDAPGYEAEIEMVWSLAVTSAPPEYDYHNVIEVYDSGEMPEKTDAFGTKYRPRERYVLIPSSLVESQCNRYHSGMYGVNGASAEDVPPGAILRKLYDRVIGAKEEK
jgi:hypothetical protein